MRISPSVALVGSGQFGLSSRFDCHLYAVQAPEGVVLFDAGSGLKHDWVVDHLRSEFADLSRGAIVITHAHPDHVCGLAALAGELGWPVYASALSRPILETGDEAAAGLVVTRAMGGYPPICAWLPAASTTSTPTANRSTSAASRSPPSPSPATRPIAPSSSAISTAGGRFSRPTSSSTAACSA